MRDDILVRKGRERYDIRKSPEFKKAKQIAEQKYATMSDDEKKEARANMAIDDRNLPGMPAFYGGNPLFSSGIGEGMPTEVLECGHHWTTSKIDLQGRRTYRCKHGHEFDYLPSTLF